MDTTLFKKFGFSDKQAAVYFALLYFGPSSVRTLANECHLNRGSTYDALKWLQEQGIVDFYKKDSKQFFVAEPPEKLYQMVDTQVSTLSQAKRELEHVIPELSALYNKGGERPVAKYVERGELKQVLEDVLETCERHGEYLYRTYSAEGVRKYLYEEFPSFSDARVGRGIAVRAIAMGVGGELRGLDERKWLTSTYDMPTYILIYPGKTAYISLNTHGDPMGVVVENKGIFETQKAIFDRIWETL